MLFDNEDETPMIFSLSASEELTERVCRMLEISPSDREIKRFPSGEVMSRPSESVRNRDIYVIQSTCPPVNENLMELLIFLDALKRSSCRSITCVIPYFGYARQDRKSHPREPITCKLVADLLTTAGCARVITFDIHAPQEQAFFDCQVDSLSCMPMLAHTIKEELKDDVDSCVIVSPDHGGATRARMVAERIGAPIAIIDKRRDSHYAPEAMAVIGSVEGKRCYIIDDMIDTAGTAVMAAEALKRNGAVSVAMATVHPVFSDPAYERISHSSFDHLIVTDSIPLGERFRSLDVQVVSIAPMIAGVIERIQKGHPISPIYDMYK